MAFGNAYTFGFAAAICIVCSTALATVSMGLKDKQEANARRDLQKNILEALDLPAKDGNGVRPSISGDAIDTLWNEKVELVPLSQKDGKKLDTGKADVDGSGTFDSADLQMSFELAKAAAGNPGEQSWYDFLMVAKKVENVRPDVIGVYRRTDTGTVAIPMKGKGLWGPISGYLAFDKKITTVQGATFFAPKETPGLGEKIQRTEFEAMWNGKQVVKDGKTVPIRVPKPSECDDTSAHCVDGISGATLTSQGVDKMVTATLEIYEPYIQTVR